MDLFPGALRGMGRSGADDPFDHWDSRTESYGFSGSSRIIDLF